MEKEKQSDDFLDLEWSGDYQEINTYGDPFIREFFQYKDNDIFQESFRQKSPPNKNATMENELLIDSLIFKQELVTSIQQDSGQRQPMKRDHSNINVQKSSNDYKNDKQQLYSKVYRQRKKQKYKNLQEQNEYLKRRINELQSQLRQQEIQLNRFKFPPPEKELSVQELNNQFIDMSTGLLENIKSKPAEYKKKQFPKGDYFHQFFLQSYAQRGFAGKKKLKLLNYHFNQLLESLLKDSEKYLCLVYANSKSSEKIIPLIQFQPINNTFKEVFTLDEDLNSRFKIFNKFLQPLSFELNKHISQLYKKFEDILQCTNKIHNFIRDTYINNNMDIASRRLQMQKWFDFYKYGKMMRKLRYQWFQWIKKLASKQEQETKGAKKGSKKKKVSEQI